MGLSVRSRFAATCLAVVGSIGFFASPPGAVADAPTRDTSVEPEFDACPHIWAFQRGGNSEFYALVLYAKTAMTVDVKLRVFMNAKSYTLPLPAVAIVKPTDTLTLPFRSKPIVLRSPDTSVEPSIIVSFGGDSTSCPPESRDLARGNAVRYKPGAAFANLETQISNEADDSGVHGLPEDASPDTPACAQPYNDATALKPVSPDYPEIAKQEGDTGTSIALVTIDSHGAMRSVETFASSGSQSLDQATLVAARKSSYLAQRSACIATAGSYLFRATFASATHRLP